jgi:hypothetical protein
MDELTHLEQAVLRMLLAGRHPVLESLRAQLESVRALGREGSPVAFSTRLGVGPLSRSAALGAETVVLDDVYADIPGLSYGAAFALFVVRGFLRRLDGATYRGEEWPRDVGGFTLHYDEPERDLSDLD